MIRKEGVIVTVDDDGAIDLSPLHPVPGTYFLEELEDGALRLSLVMSQRGRELLRDHPKVAYQLFMSLHEPEEAPDAVVAQDDPRPRVDDGP